MISKDKNNLIVKPENQTEAYALKMWWKCYLVDANEKKLKLNEPEKSYASILTIDYESLA